MLSLKRAIKYLRYHVKELKQIHQADRYYLLKFIILWRTLYLCRHHQKEPEPVGGEKQPLPSLIIMSNHSMHDYQAVSSQFSFNDDENEQILTLEEEEEDDELLILKEQDHIKVQHFILSKFFSKWYQYFINILLDFDDFPFTFH